MQRVTIYYNKEMSEILELCRSYGIKVAPKFREFVENCDLSIVKDNVIPRQNLWTNRSYESTEFMTKRIAEYCIETGMSRPAVYTALLNAFLKTIKESL